MYFSIQALSPAESSGPKARNVTGLVFDCLDHCVARGLAVGAAHYDALDAALGHVAAQELCLVVVQHPLSLRLQSRVGSGRTASLVLSFVSLLVRLVVLIYLATSYRRRGEKKQNKKHHMIIVIILVEEPVVSATGKQK